MRSLILLVTDYGSNKSAVLKILKEKFGVALDVPNVRALTSEHSSNFQEFKNEEIVDIIISFFEMPRGFYKIPGLKYLLRRKDGHLHPRYPQAPAVAWPRGAQRDSYIEFMTSAFNSQTKDYIHRLVIHEKTHFIWENILSDHLKNKWIEVGGWYKTSRNSSGWASRFTTTFVSPYAHLKNPNEDFAESISYYVVNPKKIQTDAKDKFNYIKNYIMNGTRYIAQIEEDLQFEVLNLFPNYDYPGKIKRVDVKVRGTQDEDKRVEIEIELLNKENLQDGADYASMRIFSEAGTFKDLHLYPVNQNKHVLRGTTVIPSSSKNGYWNVNQIRVVDQNGNSRMEGVDDFGFKLYVNNRMEDITPPQYVRNSLSISQSRDVLENRSIHKVKVKWNILELGEMERRNSVFVYLKPLDFERSYPLFSYGNTDPNTKEGEVVFNVTNFYPSGRYAVTYLGMKDKALNKSGQRFSDDPKHEKQKVIVINTTNHDSEEPVFDRNRLTVSAKPINREAPDGRTIVKITYYAKDNSSGLGKVFYLLRDPTGKVHHNYHYHKNFYTNFYLGNPNVYKKYEIVHVLPEGSAPGIWGLQEINLVDKAGNKATHNFLEIIKFRVEE